MKRLTGGERLKARFMHKDFFTFQPSHSVVLVTNHAPEVRGTDHGIWRRLRMVPWPVTFAGSDIDLEVGGKLRADLPAVLAWAVAGCMDWRERGLADPEPVRAATTEYRDGENALGRFFNDRCKFGPVTALNASNAVLRAAYLDWCGAEGEEPQTPKLIAVELRRKGCQPTRDRHFRDWAGVAVLGAKRR